MGNLESIAAGVRIGPVDLPERCRPSAAAMGGLEVVLRVIYRILRTAFAVPINTHGRRRDWTGRPSALADFIALMASPKAEIDDYAWSSANAVQRFQQTIVPCLDAAYNFARFLSRDADAAQDIVQEAFLRAYRNFDGYRGGDPRAWIFAIIRNCYYAWQQEAWRKARFEVPIADDAETATEETSFAAQDLASDEDSPETSVIRRSEAARVRQVIGSLPDGMREVLVLRELEDLSYRQIADIIDAPIGTVMSRLARARREFGDAWQRLDGGEPLS